VKLKDWEVGKRVGIMWWNMVKWYGFMFDECLVIK
jgi:hypothetical protein